VLLSTSSAQAGAYMAKGYVVEMRHTRKNDEPGQAIQSIRPGLQGARRRRPDGTAGVAQDVLQGEIPGVIQGEIPDILAKCEPGPAAGAPTAATAATASDRSDRRQAECSTRPPVPAHLFRSSLQLASGGGQACAAVVRTNT
jgi:hypothetical protein